MKLSKSPVGAQGAATEQKNYALFSTSVSFISCLSGLIMTLLLIGSTAFAQSCDTLDASLCDLQIIAPGGTLNIGETATFYIQIGTETEQITDLESFDIELTLGANAVVPEDPDFGIGESWFLTSAVADTQEVVDVDAGTVTLTGSRTDNIAQTGYGDLFAITLESSGNGVDPSSMITTGGGTLIVVDIGYKTQAWDEKSAPDPVLYPNPCRGRVQFDWKGQQPKGMKLVGSRGQVVEVPAASMTAGGFDLTGLAPGMYLAVIEYEGSRVVRNLIVAQ